MTFAEFEKELAAWAEALLAELRDYPEDAEFTARLFLRSTFMKGAGSKETE